MFSMIASLLLSTAPIATASPEPAAPPSAPLDTTPQTRLAPDLRCHLGVYSFPDTSSVTINGAGGAPNSLQHTLSNGTFGTVHRGADGAFRAGSLEMSFGSCAEGTVTIKQGANIKRGSQIDLIEQDTTFISDGIKMHGKIVLPANRRPTSLAVWIEGSNNNPSTDDSVWQYELARRGVGVFVYDKRGTGSSEGAPTSDFQARARDTVAALAAARTLAPTARRVGVIGGSQGGWVAPLTATLVRLDFVVAAFAMAEGPIAQDQQLVELALKQAGFDETALLQAKELTAITARIVRSNMNEGLAELDAFKAEYANAPWLSAIQPRSYTGLFLKFSSDQIKVAGPALAQGLPFDYEPQAVVASIKPRQLWLLGGSDTQAPNVGTQRVLRDIQRRRRDVAVVVFSKADHGLVEPVQADGGSAMAYSTGLFDVTANWITNQRLPVPGKFITMP